ncbi:MAG: hypothetical protein R2824_22815 [Saprospiraceae bacterium]|nr:hypothetical protein [Lewinella sp.]
MEDYDPKAFLLFALEHFSIPVQSENGKMVHLENDYTIEIEERDLFKLIQNEQVIAPFAGVEELCLFIQQDMQLND